MTYPPENAPPTDISLLLRTHCEQLWLTNQVIPLLVELQAPGGVPEEQLGAALAYLEVVRLDARRRAAETEREYAQLAASELRESGPRDRDPPLPRRRAGAARGGDAPRRAPYGAPGRADPAPIRLSPGGRRPRLQL